MASEMTEAQLYDLLQSYFGIGGYDELDEREPYFKARATEIGKLKRLMKSRNVTVDTMREAAEYAHARHLPITATWEIVEAIPDARRAAREARERPLAVRLQDAVQEATAAGETAWAQRLLLSSSQDVLDAWEARNV